MRKLLVITLIIAYVYTLTCDIFMSDIFRLPAPVILGAPLLCFFYMPGQRFLYGKELLVLIATIALYYIVGQGDVKGFVLCSVTALICGLYFAFFVGTNQLRFAVSVIVFAIVLLLSMLLLLADHYFQGTADAWRSILLDDVVKQSPSGLALTQFTFGYQLAAFTTLVAAFAITYRVNILYKLLIIAGCLVCIYFGMNRSALLSFGIAIGTLVLVFYKYKAIPVILIIVVGGFLFYNYALLPNSSIDDKNNILAKNQAKEANDFNRLDLSAENLAIYADYPLGLVFYGKRWEDVTYRNPVFPDGLSSHNAYLMFLTCLGPVLGFGLLGFIYARPAKIAIDLVGNIHTKHAVVLAPLVFALFAVSFNALSHNAWLLSGNGPTLFLYFAVLQGARIYI